MRSRASWILIGSSACALAAAAVAVFNPAPWLLMILALLATLGIGPAADRLTPRPAPPWPARSAVEGLEVQGLTESQVWESYGYLCGALMADYLYDDSCGSAPAFEASLDALLRGDPIGQDGRPYKMPAPEPVAYADMFGCPVVTLNRQLSAKEAERIQARFAENHATPGSVLFLEEGMRYEQVNDWICSGVMSANEARVYVGNPPPPRPEPDCTESVLY